MAIPQAITTTTKIGSIGVIKWLIRYWYYVILIIIILPAIISSISVAKETNNPSYPFTLLVLRLTNADSLLYDDIDTLRTSRDELIGMSKPSEDDVLTNKLKYYWKFLYNVLFRIFGNVWLIAFPFIIFYKFFRWKGSKGLKSSASHDLLSAMFWGLIFVFVINLVILIYRVSLQIIPSPFVKDIGIFQGTWMIIKQTLPFRGIYNLFSYLFNIV